MPFWVKRIVDVADRRGRRGVRAAAVEGDLVVRIRWDIGGPEGVMRRSSRWGEGRGVECRVRVRVIGEEGGREGRCVRRVRGGGEGRVERECAKSLERLPRPRMWIRGWVGREAICWVGVGGGGVLVVEGGGWEVEVRRWGGDPELWRGEEGI